MKLKAGLVALVPFALLLGACSSSPATEIDVTTTDFAFSDESWTVAADEDITINLTNDGDVTHEFVILQDGVKVTSEADFPETEEELLADFVEWEEEIESGDSGTFTFPALPAGTYQVVCAIENHFDAGMNARLIVEAP